MTLFQWEREEEWSSRGGVGEVWHRQTDRQADRDRQAQAQTQKQTSRQTGRYEVALPIVFDQHHHEEGKEDGKYTNWHISSSIVMYIIYLRSTLRTMLAQTETRRPMSTNSAVSLRKHSDPLFSPCVPEGIDNDSGQIINLERNLKVVFCVSKNHVKCVKLQQFTVSVD